MPLCSANADCPCSTTSAFLASGCLRDNDPSLLGGRIVWARTVTAARRRGLWMGGAHPGAGRPRPARATDCGSAAGLVTDLLAVRETPIRLHQWHFDPVDEADIPWRGHLIDRGDMYIMGRNMFDPSVARGRATGGVVGCRTALPRWSGLRAHPPPEGAGRDGWWDDIPLRDRPL